MTSHGHQQIAEIKAALRTAASQMRETPDTEREAKLAECVPYAKFLHDAGEPMENRWLLLLSYDHLRKGESDWVVKNTNSDNWSEAPETWGLILGSIYTQHREFAGDYERMLTEYNAAIPIAECALLNELVMRNAMLSRLYANKAFAEHKLGRNISAAASVNVSLNHMANPLAYEIMASIHMGQDSFAVISAISRAVSLRCHAKPWHLVNRANAYLETDNVVLAKQDLQAVHEEDREHVWHLTMGLLLAKIGSQDESILHYEKALAANRTYEALTNLASVRYGQLLHKHAEILLLEAISLAPTTDWRPRFNLALVYNDLGQHDKSEALFQHKNLSEADWDLQHLASRWLFRREDWDEAINQLQSAWRIAANADEQSTTLNDLGVAYNKLGNESMARAYFSMACNVDPTNTTAVNNMLLLAPSQAGGTVQASPELAPSKPNVRSLRWLQQRGTAVATWVDDKKIIERVSTIYKLVESIGPWTGTT